MFTQFQNEWLVVKYGKYYTISSYMERNVFFLDSYFPCGILHFSISGYIPGAELKIVCLHTILIYYLYKFCCT